MICITPCIYWEKQPHGGKGPCPKQPFSSISPRSINRSLKHSQNMAKHQKNDMRTRSGQWIQSERSRPVKLSEQKYITFGAEAAS